MKKIGWFWLCILAATLLPIGNSENVSWKYLEYPTETWIIERQDYFGSFLEWNFIPLNGQHGDKRVWNFSWRWKEIVEVNDTTAIPNPLGEIWVSLRNESRLQELFWMLNSSGIDGFNNVDVFLGDCVRLGRLPVEVLDQPEFSFVTVPRSIDVWRRNGSFLVALKEWRLNIRIRIGFRSTIVYSDSTNTITVTGGTETDPINFEDLYNADFAGSLVLNQSATRTTNATWSLETQVRPADSKALRLNVSVTSIFGSMTFTLNGTDIDGSPQLETLTLSAVGNYFTDKWFNSIYTNGCILEGVNSGENVTFSIQQARWGVVWKFPEVSTPFRGVYNYEFRMDSRLQIGDGVTSTWFVDESVMVSFVEPFTDTLQRAVDVKSGATFRLGQLLDATAKTSTDGGMLIVINNYPSNYWLIYEDNGVAELYSTVLYGFNIRGINEFVYLGIIRVANGKIYNSVLNKVVLILRGGDAHRLTVTRHQMAFYSGTLSDVVVSDSVNYSLDLLEAGDRTIKGGKLQRAGTANFRVGAWSYEVANHYLVNVKADSWTFDWFREPVQVTVYRQYEFNIIVTDENGTPIGNANVSIYKYGQGYEKVGSWLTWTNGTIPTQTLTMGFYNQTGGNTIYDYNPYNITIIHPDYARKSFNFTLEQPTNWIVTLEMPITVEETFAVSFGSGFILGFILVFALGTVGFFAYTKRR